ncbi:MAG: anthranilate phosphoribosyltransferase [Gammaproteobacteria bacterium]|nr:anthranilate phosphoribosyltransferase [Gammaproteobacteria bacterium]
MRSVIQRVATGPELSKNISLEEAKAATRFVLDQTVDPVQAAVFLIGLRMKRETDDEMKGVLEAICESTPPTSVEADEVVALADPYNGYNRCVPAAPFVPAVLAACGVAAYTEGVEKMGPKWGATHHQILAAAGIDVNLSSQQAAARLSDSRIAWTYIDQKVFSPKLYQLSELRRLMVKRPCLTTIDVLTGPLRGRQKTHLVTGYVHKPYPRIYAMLARHSGFDSALLIRGVEGGITPSLRQTGKCFYYHDNNAEQDQDLNPTELGISQELRAAPLPENLQRQDDDSTVAADIPALAKTAAQMGLAALRGEAGITRDALIYSGALCLWHVKGTPLPQAADQIRAVLDNGKALQHFQA